MHRGAADGSRQHHRGAGVDGTRTRRNLISLSRRVLESACKHAVGKVDRRGCGCRRRTRNTAKSRAR